MLGQGGHLRLHLLSAHLERNLGGPLNKMDPFVWIRVGGQEWRSQVCVNGGKNPHWTLQFMQVETNLFTHQMHIQVCDKDPLKAPLIGEAHVPLSVFTQSGPREEWI